MSNDVLMSRLKVKPDVFFVRSQDGVWLRNNRGSFSLRGGSAYELVLRLFERLDGTSSFDAVCRDLGFGEPQALYQRLLVPLIERGFVRVIDPQASPITEALAARFAEHLAFLELYVDDPVATLAKLRTEPIACIGSGQQLRAMAAALAELGFLDVGLFDHEDQLPRGLEELVAAVARVDQDATWSLQGLPRALELVDAAKRALAVKNVGYVVIASDDSATRPELAQACAWLTSMGKRIFVAAPAGAHVLATPVLGADVACMQCIQRSMVHADAQTPGPVATSLAALQLAQRLASTIAGEPVPQATQLTTVDGRTLHVQAHTVRRHESCSVHRVRSVPALSEAEREDTSADDLVRPGISRPTDSKPMIALQDRLVDVVSRWVDPLVGPLLAVGEAALVQLPLAASRCRFIEAGPTGEREAVIDCFGLCARETRNQVVLCAIESMVEDLSRALLPRMRLLGVGAGWSSGEAVHRALAMAALRFESPSDAREPELVRDLAHHRSERCSFLLESLGATEPRVTAHESASSFGFVRVELEAAGKRLARGVGLEPERALEHALLDAVTRQASDHGARTVVVYPEPRVERWSSLGEELVRRATVEHTLFSMRHVVPFVGRDLAVVGVALRSEVTARERP